MINQENLVIPHPRAANRDFVIFPLCDIDPYFKHPVEKKSLKKLKGEIEDIYIFQLEIEETVIKHNY